MIKLGEVKRGRKCGMTDKIIKDSCLGKVAPGFCVEEHIGSGKWKRVKSYCRNCGFKALNKERDRLYKIEIKVYGEGEFIW